MGQAKLGGKNMTEKNNTKPNYNNSRGQEAYLPEKYKGYTDSFYENQGDSGAGSFLFGAVVGGVIGAAAALFLAPKTGKEMRDDFSTQAVQLKDKGIEISAVAKDKATEFTSVAKDKAVEFTTVAKEKTDEVTKSLQEQSGQLVEKVKTMTAKTSIPMDDGTASSEGEEAIEFVEKVAEQVEENLEETVEVDTSTAEALKEAVVSKK